MIIAGCFSDRNFAGGGFNDRRGGRGGYSSYGQQDRRDQYSGSGGSGGGYRDRRDNRGSGQVNMLYCFICSVDFNSFLQI